MVLLQYGIDRCLPQSDFNGTNWNPNYHWYPGQGSVLYSSSSATLRFSGFVPQGFFTNYFATRALLCRPQPGVGGWNEISTVPPPDMDGVARWHNGIGYELSYWEDVLGEWNNGYLGVGAFGALWLLHSGAAPPPFAPIITEQPHDCAVMQGQSAALAATVLQDNSDPIVLYIWRRNGEDVFPQPGSAALIITNA
jgi:hypothetical protein